MNKKDLMFKLIDATTSNGEVNVLSVPNDKGDGFAGIVISTKDPNLCKELYNTIAKFSKAKGA
jgi:hypothetical protein